MSRKPTVAVFTTGDELVEPGMPLAPGEIYDSNRELLMGLLRADGLEPTAWPRLPDDPARGRDRRCAMPRCAFDVVITCGGVSAGEKDHLPALLAQFGQHAFLEGAHEARHAAAVRQPGPGARPRPAGQSGVGARDLPHARAAR